MHDGTDETAGARVAFSFPADPDSIGEVRHLIVEEAKTLPFSQDDLDDIALAISEVFTNLVQYAPGYRIRGTVIAQHARLEVTLEVERNISGYLTQRQFPDGLSHRGRGIPLLNLLIPSVSVQARSDGAWELIMIKPVTTHE